MSLKPNFTQGSVIQALERENRNLKAALDQQSALTRLLEQCASGFCAQLTDPHEIARLTLETAGAIASRLTVQIEQVDKSTQ